MQALLIAAGVIVQTLLGYTDYEIGLYAAGRCSACSSPTPAVRRARDRACTASSNQKYVGHLRRPRWSTRSSSSPAASASSTTCCIYGANPAWSTRTCAASAPSLRAVGSGSSCTGRLGAAARASRRDCSGCAAPSGLVRRGCDSRAVVSRGATVAAAARAGGRARRRRRRLHLLQHEHPQPLRTATEDARRRGESTTSAATGATPARRSRCSPPTRCASSCTRRAATPRSRGTYLLANRTGVRDRHDARRPRRRGRDRRDVRFDRGARLVVDDADAAPPHLRARRAAAAGRFAAPRLHGALPAARLPERRRRPVRRAAERHLTSSAGRGCPHRLPAQPRAVERRRAPRARAAGAHAVARARRRGRALTTARRRARPARRHRRHRARGRSRSRRGHAAAHLDARAGVATSTTSTDTPIPQQLRVLLGRVRGSRCPRRRRRRDPDPPPPRRMRSNGGRASSAPPARRSS